MSRSQRAFTIARREATRARRGRSLSLTSFAAFPAVLMGVALWAALGAQVPDDEDSAVAVVEGEHRAVVQGQLEPELAAALTDAGFSLEPATSEVQAGRLDDGADLGIVVNDPRRVQVLLDTSERESRAAALAFALTAERTRNERLRAVIGEPAFTLATGAAYELVDVAAREPVNVVGLVAPVLILTFLGFSGRVADLIAGERTERTFEPLLVLPVRSSEVLLGKCVACLPYLAATVASVAAAVALTTSLATDLPASEVAGTVLTVVVLMLPLVCTPMAIGMLIGSLARSTSRAHLAGGAVTFVAALLAGAVSFGVLGPPERWFAAPVVGAVGVAARAPSPGSAPALAYVLTTLALAAALWAAAARLLRSERSVLGDRA